MGLDLWARTSNSKILQAGGYQSGRLMVLGEGDHFTRGCRAGVKNMIGLWGRRRNSIQEARKWQARLCDFQLLDIKLPFITFNSWQEKYLDRSPNQRLTMDQPVDANIKPTNEMKTDTNQPLKESKLLPNPSVNLLVKETITSLWEGGWPHDFCLSHQSSMKSGQSNRPVGYAD